MDDFNDSIDSLIHLEQSFYNEGYSDGFAHGRIHGLIEGRALGREKGFEMWEELGFYEGFARLWTSANPSDSRTKGHLANLIALIEAFPRSNPKEEDGVDIQKQLKLIRTRYKMLCASLGVKPSLRAGAGGEEKEGDGNGASGGVWEVKDMSF